MESNLFDIKTIVACNAAFSLYIFISMLLYKIEHQTYPGYSFWMMGTLFVSVAYLMLILSKNMPSWVFIFVHGSVAMAEVLRYDSASRFVVNKPVRRSFYMLPLIYMAVVFFFSAVNDNVLVRNILVGIISMLVIAPTAAKYFFNLSPGSRILYITAGLIYILYGLALLSRSVAWLLFPQDSFYTSGTVQQLYLFSFMIFEIALGVMLLMMNSRRLEQDLIASRDNLKATVDNLIKAMREVKTLSGLLPICATCKKIRDDKGYWNQIERYIKDHSEAEFSHSLCPECLEKQYPKYAKKVLKKL